ncbi:MAG TPA: tRNA lysidine(34) synthetase TilS [Bacteroidota bacterium]|nr:tRNA lysidine(34) synthetase TilS [Bacteroidota bacterium]
MSHHRHALETQFIRFLESTGMVRPGDSIVLAVSGGIDSTVMSVLFANLRQEWNLSLTIAHVNHQLRGEESEGDELFVRNLAGRLSIPFISERVNILDFAHSEHVSKQEAARQLRYQSLERARRRVGARSIATAHQADDNAETVLMNALRGTGIRGLAGIPLQRDSGMIIRPLLFARRDEIREFARDRAIEYRNDSSNESVEYRRNYIRHNVLPLLEASGSFDTVPSLNRLSRLMRQLDDILTAEVRLVLPGILTRDDQGVTQLDIGKLQAKPEYLQEGILLEVLRKLGAEIDSDKILKLIDLCTLTTGSQVQLSRDVHVYRDRDLLRFVRPAKETPLHQVVSLGNSYTFQDFRFSISLPIPPPSKFSGRTDVEFVDAGRLGAKLLVRSWEDGDWFMPFGMSARKKISDYFVDKKISLLQKKKIPILESNGDIVWICGLRLDERFKVTRQTRSVVRLEYGATISSH